MSVGFNLLVFFARRRVVAGMSGAATPIRCSGLALALKIAITVSITVAASVVVERSGPFIGALIASLPTAGGAALIILAVEHTRVLHRPEHDRQHGASRPSARCLLWPYAALAQRARVCCSSLGGAFAVWFGGAFGSRLIDWTANSALLLDVAVFAGRPSTAANAISR